MRAYPGGQGVCGQGWLVQAELRQKLREFTAFALFDAGMRTANTQPWDGQPLVRERISGSGLGLRLERPLGWSMEALVAARHSARLPSDHSAGRPRVLFMASHRY